MDNQDFLLPDDYVEEDTTESSNEVEVEEVTPEATTEGETTETAQPIDEPVNSFELDYKFNHQEGKLTDKAEAQRLVQLGLLYQSKEPEFNELKMSKAQVEKINQLANLYGMTFDEMHESLYNQYVETQAEKTGYTPQQIRKERELADKEQALTAKEQAEKKAAEDKASYERFFAAYPNATAKDIKPETWQLVDKGVDLTTAYTMQLNKELQEQLKITTQNVKNKSTSPPVGTTQQGTADTVKDDEFLAGFWGN